MTICCDTSFLISLYGKDSHTERAKEERSRFRQPVTLSRLNEFEFHNAVLHATFRKSISRVTRSMILSDFEADLARKRFILARCSIEKILHHAKHLFRIHTEIKGYRSFDILHAASAIHLRAAKFLTFDTDQKRLAQTEGLTVL